MIKILLVFIAGVSICSIWLDPFTYTLHPAGPELSPVWWRAVALLDTILLTAFAWSVVRANWWSAYGLIALSTALSLLANAGYVRLRGVDRFLVVFRTEELLSVYLFTSGLRVAAMFTCGIALISHSRHSRAET
jgi:hypothetical protein